VDASARNLAPAMLENFLHHFTQIEWVELRRRLSRTAAASKEWLKIHHYMVEYPP
jgi:hypothetical protein